MTICMNIYICICMWCIYVYVHIGFPGGSSGIDSTCNNPGAIEEAGWIPGLGRSPGGGSGNPLQYSHLGNPMDRGAWWAIVPSVAKSQTQLKQLSTCTHIHTHVLPYISCIYIIIINILYVLLWTAIIDWNLFSHSPGDWKSKMKMPGGSPFWSLSHWLVNGHLTTGSSVFPLWMSTPGIS